MWEQLINVHDVDLVEDMGELAQEGILPSREHILKLEIMPSG